MYALGLIPWAARIATRTPGAANRLLGAPVVGDLARRAAGVTTRRPAPPFARRSLRRSVPSLAAHGPGEATVVVWPDTFTDAFRPEAGHDLVAVLAALGERVAVPADWACCGRPLYDMGMLTLARRTLRHLVDTLEPWTARGTPVVVPEPSCLAAFRDELPQLLRDDPRAARLASLGRSPAEHLLATGRLEAALAAAPEKGREPTEPASVALHPHCHQRAVVGTAADRRVLELLGYRVEVLDAGCCGLAGSFGFQARHEEVSRAIGEQSWLPKVRAALGDDPGRALVVDAFSCATQLDHLGGPPSLTLMSLLRRRVAPCAEQVT
jgi:Fe-S oxidoreductase